MPRTTFPGAKDEGFKFFEADELERLMLDAGFSGVKVRDEGRGKGRHCPRINVWAFFVCYHAIIL